MTLLLLFAACSTDTAGTAGASFRLFAGEPGRLYELRAPAAHDADTGSSDTGTAAPTDTAPAEATPSRWLRLAIDAWTLTEGPDADDSLAIATWPLTAEDGLVVDGTRLLPTNILAGAAADGATVRAVAPWETRYGTFPEAAEVEVAEGAWAGTQVFAKGVGPVYLTIAGVPWEMVWYE
ncbi:MAG: hypothetical protein Q8P41_11465 [Pseudomonadota bacterium]|nr:hypothetical protein [Pseudomonadota bacterium]